MDFFARYRQRFHENYPLFPQAGCDFLESERCEAYLVAFRRRLEEKHAECEKLVAAGVYSDMTAAASAVIDPYPDDEFELHERALISLFLLIPEKTPERYVQ